MALKITNISNGKIIGIGEVTVLPGETKEVPVTYEYNPALEVYTRMNMAIISGEPTTKKKTKAELEAELVEAQKKALEEKEAVRKSRLASLDGASEEEVARLAIELGINPADCKDQADVVKKVKAALKK